MAGVIPEGIFPDRATANPEYTLVGAISSAHMLSVERRFWDRDQSGELSGSR
jgi:hypothetical protein